MVSTSAAISGWVARIVAVAISPPPGRCRPISTTSGRAASVTSMGVLRGGRLTNDLDVIDPSDESTKALPEDHVVVHDHQADRRHRSTGIRACSEVPPSGAAPKIECTAEGLDPAAMEVMPIPLTFGLPSPIPSSVTRRTRVAASSAGRLVARRPARRQCRGSSPCAMPRP
jgi:hypothetical protein